MADTKISALTAATTPLAGTEVLPIVQSGTTKQVSVANLTAGRAISASSLSLTTALTAVNGGTSFSTYAVGDILYANTTSTLAKLADVATGNALISGGVGVAPSWGKVGLTTHISGTLGTSNGGTGLASFTTNSVFYASSTSAVGQSANLTFDGTAILTAGAVNITQNNKPANGLYLPASNALSFSTNSTENGRISNGYLKLTNNASYVDTAGTYYELNSNSAAVTCYLYNSSATGDGHFINLNSSGTAQYFLRGYSASAAATNGYWWTDGSWQIAAGKTYGNLSDAKLKENIVDATPKLADVMRLKVRNYGVKKEPGSKYIGWIAQEFEQVFPNLVDETPDTEFVDVTETDKNGNEITKKVERATGTTTKRIKESAMIPILTKALQELAQEFEAYKAAHP